MSMNHAFPIRRATAAVAAGAALAAALGAAVPGAQAAGTTAGFKATVPFSGGRSADLRVGEPLEFSVKGERIAKVCWSPAPIQHAACGTALAAPARAGTQKFTVTLKSGKVLHESIRVGARATHLPTNPDASGAPGAHVVEYKATCAANAYATVDSKGHLKGTGPKSANLTKGDLVAGFYQAGGHAIQALAYRDPVPAFYLNRCLTRVK